MQDGLSGPSMGLASSAAATVTHIGLGRIFAAHASELAKLAAASAEHCAADVARATEVVAEALQAGHKVMACGNGGSAADAQHFVAELVGRYRLERRPLPAISLTCDSSIMTAVGNDYGYEQVFSRQVEALGSPGDVLVAISTSGRSANVLHAARKALELGMAVVALTGSSGEAILDRSEAWCRVGSSVTAHIQEIHTAMLHAICVGAEILLGYGEVEE